MASPNDRQIEGTGKLDDQLSDIGKLDRPQIAGPFSFSCSGVVICYCHFWNSKNGGYGELKWSSFWVAVLFLHYISYICL